jgi:surface polysaccharide O-acyltransferase-like enzyme
LKSRMAGIDAVRFIAVFCVVLIHTAHGISYTILIRPPLGPQFASFRISIGDVITELCRWAVPFFFVSAGYFAWRPEERLSVTASRLAQRVFPVYLIWSVLYNLASPWNFQWFFQPNLALRWILNGGAGDHLWFLPALFIWVVAARFLKAYFSWPALFSVALVFYLGGWAMSAGQSLFLHSPNHLLFTLARDGPSFGLIFVLAGMWLRYTGLTISFYASLALFVVSAAAQLGEAYLLNRLHILPFFQSDYLLATLPFGVSAFMLALKLTKPEAILDRLAVLGRFALGIYAVHMFFVQYIAFFAEPAALGGRLVVALAALLGSVGVVLAMARVKILKPLVF